MTTLDSKRIVIIGGGTFNHIRNHLSLAAPAFGDTAKYLHKKLNNSILYLTKMAGGKILSTNEDVSKLVDNLIQSPNTGTIIMSAAICDFEAEWSGSVPNGSHAERLKTKDGDVHLNLYPSEKIIKRIRLQRPDIFLVGFKTTTNQTRLEQYYTALKFMKNTKCNLVFANDVVTRLNMIIVPEEAKYHVGTNRQQALNGLLDLIHVRQNLTYNKTNLIQTDNVNMTVTPKTFQNVIEFLVYNGGFIEDNGNGFTPGHFCYKWSDDSFLSSQRKTNHNNVFKQGLTWTIKPIHSTSKIIALGTHKPSVGATSQRLLFEQYPKYDCIVHTHNPLKLTSTINRISQYNFQCGSIECGKNTLSGMHFNNNIGAVYLEKHGVNIMFKSTDDPNKIIDFIKNNLQLGIKIQ